MPGTGATIESDSLSLLRMITRKWKAPWSLIHILEDIWCSMHALEGHITHIFREGNTVADALANDAVQLQHTMEFYGFMDLPNHIRRCINMDKL